MSKTLYVEIEFAGLHQKKPADWPGLGDSPQLTINGINVWSKYSIEVGYGDPGEPPAYDTFDYSEFSIAGASFDEPSDLNATDTYQTEYGHTGSYLKYHRIIVPDDFQIPDDTPSILSIIARQFTDIAEDMAVNFASLFGFDLLGTALTSYGIYGAVSHHIDRQFHLIDQVTSGEISPQEFEHLSTSATFNFVLDLAETAEVPPVLVDAVRYQAFSAQKDTGPGGLSWETGDGETIDIDYSMWQQDPTLVLPRQLSDRDDGFVGTPGNDAVYAERGNDVVLGHDGDDAMYGGEGDDYISLGRGNDFTSGDDGDDTLIGGSGNDRIDGGAGTDTAVLEGLRGGGFDIIQANGTVYALDFNDHSRDIINNVESFESVGQTIGLSGVRSFDALAYAASYDDLAHVFRTSADGALSHYVMGGFFEGRHDSFDAAQYLANYAGLRAAFGDDTHAATLHFLAGGVDEHRLAEDPLDYIASFPDLIEAFHGHSQAELQALGLWHYQAAGNAEGRRGGIDFDADQYLANYAGLRAAFGDDDDAAATHFINGGYFEHRLAENPLEYIASYADLIGAFHGQTEAQLRVSGLQHYQAGGFNEGREAGIDFDVDQYLANYADLRAVFADGHGGYNEDAALYHYIAGGYDEGRTDHILMA